VPEAEDVVLEAVHRASARARAIWRSHGGEGDAPAARAAAGRRRIAAWCTACFGREWPILALDPPPRPGWLRRLLADRAPWETQPEAAATSDARRLLLPRALLQAPDAPARQRLLVAALGLGHRIASGAVARTPETPAVARDAFWCLAGTRADAALAALLPGLAPALDAARREALAARPPPEALRPAERRVEELVRRLLLPPARIALRALPEPLRPEPEGSCDSDAAYAQRLAAALAEAERTGYRGAAPVAHWGVPRPDLVRETARGRDTAGSDGPLPPRRSRTLRRRLERRRADPAEADGRPGSFLPSPADPQLSLQDPAGLRRPRDCGDEDPDELAEILEEQAQASAVESDDPVREVLDDGAAARGAPRRSPAAAGHDAALRYPEWDCARFRYRPGACRLRELSLGPGDPDWAARVLSERRRLLARLRRHFEPLRTQRAWRRRQLDGSDLDLDAWVDEYAERRAGGAPGGRIYLLEERRRRDVAVALLVDASGSTDAWVNGRQRVIDVAKEAALCFSQVLAGLGDRCAVYAFSGRGSGDVRVWTAKRFEEAASETTRARIGAIEPDAFTRLGAPLRHVAARLACEPARARLLLLLSDGRPDDEDVYEGTYGVEDVRQAVAEARLQGLHVFCATIDREGPAYLPRLFGPAGYAVLRRAEELPERLLDLYRRLTATGS
jgi:nitric oxide reductase NorD protein